LAILKRSVELLLQLLSFLGLLGIFFIFSILLADLSHFEDASATISLVAFFAKVLGWNWISPITLLMAKIFSAQVALFLVVFGCNQIEVLAIQFGFKRVKVKQRIQDLNRMVFWTLVFEERGNCILLKAQLHFQVKCSCSIIYA
jgi:hypothetical protein